MRSPRIISQGALSAFAYGAMSNPPLYSSARANITPPAYVPINLEHVCAPVINPTTGKIILEYNELTNNPEVSEVWRTAFGKEFCGLAQGDNKTSETGSINSIFDIPKDRKVTYRIIVN